LLPDNLTAQRRCDFMETVLTGLLEDVPPAVREVLDSGRRGSRPLFCSF
jgi:hypothetical protein